MSKLFFPATAMPDADWWQALWPDPGCALRKLGFKPEMSVVDLCCGDGHFTAVLAKMLNGPVYALDIDPSLLAQAKARSCEPVIWIESDARELPERVDSLVDVVFIANTFHGVPEQTGLAKAVGRVLKPGGQFMVVNWHVAKREDTPVLGQPRGPRRELRMSPIEVAKKVEPAGLELIRVIELPPYHYGAIFQKPA